MALAIADEIIVERFTGPLRPSDGEKLEDRLQALGSAYGLALQILMTRRGQMSVEATTKASGDDSSNHAANLKALDDRIGELVSFMSTSVDVTPTTAESLLIAQAVGGGGTVTAIVPGFVSVRRRG